MFRKKIRELKGRLKKYIILVNNYLLKFLIIKH